MRGVKAKRLRKIARLKSEGLPERQLLATEHLVVSKGKAYKSIQAVNDMKSTRGIYLGLKRGHLALT